MLAGVPMMNGTSDPRRLYSGGGRHGCDPPPGCRSDDPEGKAHCENYCLSGSSHSNATGPCHNPHRMGYSAGGSSSGSAALVAAGEVDMAIGGDQGGSIRMPASFCGIYGMKPTHGLVPYTGVLGIEAGIDHVGPMTANVADNALMLEAIAGADGIDGRQRDVVTHPYSEMLEGGVSGLRIAIIEEGFDHPGSEAESDAVVRAACAKFSELGAEVETISFPLHREAAVMYFPALAEGLAREMMLQGGVFYGLPGMYVGGALERSNRWMERGHELPPTVRAFTLLGRLVHGGARRAHLRQGHEPAAQGEGRLRAADGELRPPADADHAAGGAGHAGPGRLDHRILHACLEHAGQLPDLQLHRPALHVRALRHGGRPAGRADDYRALVGRADDLQGGGGLRGELRLAFSLMRPFGLRSAR